jgi:hypothetical protein
MASLIEILGRKVIKDPLGEIGFRQSSNRSIACSFKDLLRTGEASVDRELSQGRYDVGVGNEKLYEALESSFFHGTHRFLKQLQLSYALSENEFQPAAWRVVTHYYACFFAANEILRLSGVWCFFINSDDAKCITEISPVGVEVSAGTYLLYPDLSDEEISCKMVKTTDGGGIHRIMWSQLSATTSIKRTKISSGSDLLRYDNLKMVLSNSSWPIPSNIRNHWNYENPSLYGKSGEAEVKHSAFCNPSKSMKWATKIHKTHALSDELSGLSYLCSLLHELIKYSLPLVLTSDKQRKLTSGMLESIV